MRRRELRVVLLPGLALALAAVLWITLVSRPGSDERMVYAPFWSYREIANGSLSLLLEDAANVLLFVPVGLFAAWVLRLGWPAAVLLSFGLSLVIESCQWLFWLGSFEFDDLLHNTLGALLGVAFAKKTGVGQRLARLFEKKDLLVISVLVAAFLAVPLGGQWVHLQSMKRFAALSDRENGAANLLVLDGKNGSFEEADVRVSYCDDGSVLVDGASEKRAWFILGKVTLPAGAYRFSGFSAAPENTFDLELERLDRNLNKFIRVVALDSGEDAVFTLESETRLRVLVGVFPGAKGQTYFRPAIYRED